MKPPACVLELTGIEPVSREYGGRSPMVFSRALPLGDSPKAHIFLPLPLVGHHTEWQPGSPIWTGCIYHVYSTFSTLEL